MHGAPKMKKKTIIVDDEFDDLMNTMDTQLKDLWDAIDEYGELTPAGIGSPYIMHKAAPRPAIPSAQSTINAIRNQVQAQAQMSQSRAAPVPKFPEISFKLVLNEKDQFVQAIADQRLNAEFIYDENIRFKFENGVKTLTFTTESTAAAYNMFFDDPDWIKMYEIQVNDHGKPVRMVKIKKVISVDSNESFDESSATFTWVVEV